MNVNKTKTKMHSKNKNNKTKTERERKQNRKPYWNQMKNVIKELLLMRKCMMTNDYYISVKNKTNCFLNSCKKTQSYTTIVFHLFPSHEFTCCPIVSYVYTLYSYTICILHLGISDSLWVIGNERQYGGYIYIERKRQYVSVLVCVSAWWVSDLVRSLTLW